MKLKIAILALLAASICSQAQPFSLTGGSFTPTPVTLPTTNLTAAAGATNMAAGWSAVTSFTNTSTLWNSSSNAFVITTNIVSSTNTVYADMSVTSQRDVLIVMQESAGIGTNVVLFGRLLDSTHIDTNTIATLTFNHAAAGTITASTNLNATIIGGAGGVRVIAETWTAAAAGCTNNYLYYGKINSLK